MRLFAVVAVVLCLLVTTTVAAGELQDLKVLYVGPERTDVYIEFLKPHVAKVGAVARTEFQPAQAAEFDVVLLDWPQSELARSTRSLTSPLGDRKDWSKPTVLLGSAGLNLAVAWQMIGGSGCTCLDPIAYDVRNHRIFQHPYSIDLKHQVSIETPESFRDDLEESTIAVLPLVDDLQRNWRPGWCTYSSHFDDHPDVEFFCGGVNDKTPSAAAIWREGNLLHFGFEQSPAELNEAGQQMLLNSIAYISDFSQDRPIAVVPSVFAGPASRPRATVAKWLADETRAKWVEDIVSPDVWNSLAALEDVEQRVIWAKERTKLFRPGEEERLTIDEDLQPLDIAFDDQTFVATMIEELRSGDSNRAKRAARLLKRYVPDGPRTGDAQQWSAWWTANKPYAFASDFGRYRWYIDPLARQRGVPSSKLRGPARADR